MSTFQLERLDNSLRILTAPMESAQSVTCAIMLAAGSRYETADTNGIAHFSEHMFFKGTERRPTARDIGVAIDGIGGEFNAFTAKEYTGYYVKCAAEHRGVALDVLTDMLRHSKFETEEIEREKGVIIEEMNMYFDTPRDFIGGVYEELLYGDQPLVWDIIGRKETVRGATRDTFMGYLDRWYKPTRMVVGIGGAVGERIEERIGELLGDLEAADTGEAAPVEPHANGRVKVFTKQSDQAHIVLGVESFPIVHPDRYTLQLLSTVLGGGMSSRLFTEVRERRGLAYYVFAHHASYTDTGSLLVQAGVDVKRVSLAVETIAAELVRTVREHVSDDELTKAKRFLTGRLVLGLEDPRGQILHGLRGELLEGRTRELDEITAGFDSVTADDVQRVAEELIRPELMTVAAIGPI